MKEKRSNSMHRNQEWDLLINFISERFGHGDKLDLQAVLFLIGINELGQGYREFSKDEKINLLHIAICKLLSRFGYYEFSGRDQDGWPHWSSNTSMPALKPAEQKELMKESALIYFRDSGIFF